ncbi:MAG: coproporphyrinogen dehydrogenase HemZ, partial [Clostridiales bacterium]|nr:coproporphyrinogen dehydrogenase HemZ [Clostridiales bacterium]
MELTLRGHEDRYAVEQLMLALFPESGGTAVSTLSRGKTWITAGAAVTLDGRTSRAARRIKTSEESVRLRRRALQQAFYAAALPLLPGAPPWGALAGVRPTKITSKYLSEGHTPKEADRLLKDVYYVTPERRRLAVDCSQATLRAKEQLLPEDISLYVGIPFCPTRCAYCSFV